MKKYSMFMAGILGAMLVFVMVLAGCKTDPDPEPNPFEGTWKGTVDGRSVTLTITDSGWTTEGLAKGTYTRNGNTATFTQTHEWDDDNEEWEEAGDNAQTSSATVVGTTMTVAYNDGSKIRTGTLTKQ
jgi:hypothetical protein